LIAKRDKRKKGTSAKAETDNNSIIAAITKSDFI
jgi:hypothetical protein